MAQPLDRALVTQLHHEAGAARWGVDIESFGRALERSVEHAGVTEGAVDAYARSLNLEDLALSTACIDGIEIAWEHFVGRYRPILQRAADALAPTGGARELADALHGDLYATLRDGDKRALLEYFHGRSSLATWLRAVLARRYVDRVRAARRVEPLEDEERRASAEASPGFSGEREGFLTLMRRALRRAVGRLEPRDRLRLSCYYAQDLTLAQIGRVLGEHEATVSRHLSRARQCFAAVVEDAGTFNVADWLGTDAARKVAPVDRSKE
jgi:RNA polymerase sigma factor (sigma-70 family)